MAKIVGDKLREVSGVALEKVRRKFSEVLPRWLGSGDGEGREETGHQEEQEGGGLESRIRAHAGHGVKIRHSRDVGRVDMR